jgi:hypothetical protein
VPICRSVPPISSPPLPGTSPSRRDGGKQGANHLGLNSKTDVEPRQWLAAALDGSRRAMRYIVDHCVQDVLVLEKVIGALKAYSGTYNTYGSGF